MGGKADASQNWSRNVEAGYLKALEKLGKSQFHLEEIFMKHLSAARPMIVQLLERGNKRRNHAILIPAMVEVVREAGKNGDNTEQQALESLGKRHSGYGVKPEYFGYVGEAMSLTLAEVLGSEWSKNHLEEWKTSFNALIEIMLQGYSTFSRSGSQRSLSDIMEPMRRKYSSGNLDDSDFGETTASAVSATDESFPLLEESSEDTPDEVEHHVDWVACVTESFELIKPKLSASEKHIGFGAVFYGHLFKRNPHVKPLFKGIDQLALHDKIVHALYVCVEGLVDPSSLKPIIVQLGKRHVMYGALEGALPAVGESLLIALEEVHDGLWTKDMLDSWSVAIGAIAGWMTEGLRSAGSQPGSVEEAEEEIQTPILAEIWSAFSIAWVWGARKSLVSAEPEQQKAPLSKRCIQEFKRVSWLGWCSLVTLPLYCYAVMIIPIVLYGVGLDKSTESINYLLNYSDTICLGVSLIAWLREGEARDSERKFRLWSVVDGASESRKSRSRMSALEELVKMGVSLEDLVLDGFYNVGICFKGANLMRSSMQGSNCQGTDFSGANLSHGDLRGADCCASTMVGASLEFCKLQGAKLCSANLSGTRLICADFTDCNCSGACFRDAHTAGAKFKNTYLLGADLRGSKLTRKELIANGCEIGGAMLDS